jgi:hypothetical protein
VILSWSPPDHTKVGKAYNRGEMIIVPAGQVAELVTGNQRVAVTGLTTFEVAASPLPDRVSSLASALQRFASLFQLRSGNEHPQVQDLWLIDPRQAGPHCLPANRLPAISVPAGELPQTFEIVHKGSKATGFAEIGLDGQAVNWPANVPFEPSVNYILRNVSDNASVERTFKIFPVTTPATDTIAAFLDADCMAQASAALLALPRQQVGPELAP